VLEWHIGKKVLAIHVSRMYGEYIHISGPGVAETEELESDKAVKLFDWFLKP
jgi:hypothetical protein